MCLIIFKPKGKKISKKRLEYARVANPDGWGLLWNKDNKLFSCIGLEGNFDERFWPVFQNLINHNLFIHFRTASSGQKKLSDCHPYFVNGNLAFMQNGNFFEYSDWFKGGVYNDKKTDIQRFNELVLRKMSEFFLDNKSDAYNALSNYCSNNFSKMAFMDNRDKIMLIGEEKGEWENGIWYSNGGIKNYIGYGYSGAYYYRNNDVRHKGGLTSVQMLQNKNNWVKCFECEGWFYNSKIKNNICNNCRIWIRLKDNINENR